VEFVGGRFFILQEAAVGFFGTRRLDHGFVIWDDSDECPGVDGIQRKIFEFLDVDFAGDSPCIVLTSVGVETFDVVLPDGLHFLQNAVACSWENVLGLS
jgi:hypothetical protein